MKSELKSHKTGNITRDDCSTCGKKVKGARFSCCFLSKIMHLTTVCTEFNQASIEALAKMDHNLLHICNSCTEKKTDFLKTNISSESKIGSQLEALQQQMEPFTQKTEDTNNQVSDVKKKMRELKEAQHYFPQSTRKCHSWKECVRS